VTDTKKSTRQPESRPGGRARGRPRRFDEGAAVATAQHLFHERGYDGVGVAELGAAIGIGAPSLYAAFGSKLGLFERALDAYAGGDGAFIRPALERSGPVAEVLPALLADAVEAYTRADCPPGCLVMSGTRNCTVPEAVTLAQARQAKSWTLIRERIARERPDDAECLADLTMVLLGGLSGLARDGVGRDRLVAVARTAAAAYA